MGDAIKKLTRLALALAPAERRELIETLVASEHALDADWELAWASEIAARVARDPHGDRSVPASEALAAARARLRRA